MPCSEALLEMAPSVRPSLSPITRVGVFALASPCIDFTSVAVQGLPVLRVDFDIVVFPKESQ